MESLEVNPIPLVSYAAVVPRSQTENDFAQRLAFLRKQRSFTQQQLSERVGVHVQQLKRYEAGSSQPTLDVIRNMAVALGVTADQLLFGKDERGPDEDLRLQFEAVSRFSAEEKKVLRSLLDSMILTHEARRWSSRSG
jgi:transcriptional regulator with XRE-family HTH domain